MEKALRDKLEGGEFRDVAEVNSRRMGAVKGRGNRTTEVVLRMALVRYGVRGWTMHPKSVPGKPDFYFPVEKVAVFADGCFWHGCPRCGHAPKANSPFWSAKIARNRERDAEKMAALALLCVRSLRFWEHELKESLVDCIVTIRTKLADRDEPVHAAIPER